MNLHTKFCGHATYGRFRLEQAIIIIIIEKIIFKGIDGILLDFYK